MTTTITAAAAAAAPQQPQSHDVAPPTTTAAAAVVVAGTDENTSGAETDVKHPLQASWVMWYDNSSKSRLSAADWDKSLCSIFEFRFVEDFWGCVVLFLAKQTNNQTSVAGCFSSGHACFDALSRLPAFARTSVA
eukprot:TRINITY_DN2593_c0_g1_i1.p2 TRINITY_DN2593_c0_g1~~TRINITY_DN2593_c0_g1_i1.p2  ORF type:complete len:135 (+),score=39.15 TRINITY_DN2593_c0_g1_i1:119-523(+)